MKALDLFCKAGGASVGLSRAGFDVTGVDIEPQPNYPFRFIQGDALWFRPGVGEFDFVWASPPCQAHSSATRTKSNHADLIEDTRERLLDIGLPFVIENVIGAPLRSPVTLCGAMFDLGVIRHRLFEVSGFMLMVPPHPKHKGSLVTGEYVTVAGNGGVPAWTMKEREKRGLPRHVEGEMKLETWKTAMGIDWTMTREEVSNAIPPAYGEFIGRAAMSHLLQHEPASGER